MPFLMVLDVIEGSLGLSFLTYVLQLIGMILGVISSAEIALRKRAERQAKRKADDEEADHESTTGWME